MAFHQQHNSLGNYTYNRFFYDKDIYEPHFHKNFELICVLDGSIRCLVNNLEYILKKDDFGLCLPNDIHAIYPNDNSRYWVIVFSEDFVHTFSTQVKGKKANGFTFRCDDSIRDFVMHNLIYSNESSIFILKSCLYALCNEFKKSVQIEENRQIQFTDKICRFVEENHTQAISLKDLAEYLGYDYHYISRYFHKTFNMSFVDFLNTFRIQTALMLLDDEQKKMVDIACESGFNSLRSFNDCFKKAVGMSPSEYKKSTRS